MKVVLVDDDDALRGALTELLKRAGHQVSSCADGATGLKAVDEADLLVTDLRMPGFDGLSLLREARLRRPTLQVIVMTGYADVPNVVTAVKGGAVDFLEKPFNDELLLERVRQAIRLDQRQRMEAVRANVTAELLQSLTPRETQVMELLVAGRRTKQIAHDLNISPKTADIHRAHVLEKMKVDTVVDLVRLVHDLPD